MIVFFKIRLVYYLIKFYTFPTTSNLILIYLYLNIEIRIILLINTNNY